MVSCHSQDNAEYNTLVFTGTIYAYGGIDETGYPTGSVEMLISGPSIIPKWYIVPGPPMFVPDAAFAHLVLPSTCV